MILRKWYFRLDSGEWGYVQAESALHAVKVVMDEHGAVPVLVEIAENVA